MRGKLKGAMMMDIHCSTNAANSQQYCSSAQFAGKTLLAMDDLQGPSTRPYGFCWLLALCWLAPASTVNADSKATVADLLAVGLFGAKYRLHYEMKLNIILRDGYYTLGEYYE